ncbi:hypothetical protein [Chryseolinea sp. H1M3-3]|uniref:hypothetical protein n=1 Tax=Chryseolinea sp. H1M3-3 TaxID=3034144 RepID=UPI0023EE091B|nr:hypothetical protein [Chryseolinea sp. H1M3-3]
MRGKRIFRIIIACILTFFGTRALIGIMAGDFAYSLIPGWHTIIYPPAMSLTVLTGILLVLTLIVIGLYKCVSLLVAAVFDRLVKRKD